jgi:hypothetical protein
VISRKLGESVYIGNLEVEREIENLRLKVKYIYIYIYIYIYRFALHRMERNSRCFGVLGGLVHVAVRYVPTRAGQ